jgi:peptidoglycan/LPS O-acetylase OafA/YrhL
MGKGESAIILPPGALRFALAVVVMLAHYRYLDSPFDGVAVVGFFFLSGYWIARLWDFKYSRCSNPLLTFYLSRAWRIYPLAIIGLLAMLPLASFSWPALLPNFLLLPIAGWSINPPYWSLSVEMQFYLLAPLLLTLFRSHKLAAAILAVSVTGYVLFAFDLIWQSMAIGWLFAFVSGSIYARSPKPAIISRLAPYGLAFTILIGASALYFEPSRATMRFMIFAGSMTFIPYVMASLTRPSGDLDRDIGNCAYPLYVIHQPIWSAATLLLIPIPAIIVMSIAATLMLYRFIDRPLEAARRRFVTSAFSPPISFPAPALVP